MEKRDSIASGKVKKGKKFEKNAFEAEKYARHTKVTICQKIPSF